MPDIYIFGSGEKAQLILNWLSLEARILKSEVTAIVEYTDQIDNSITQLSSVPIVPLEDIKTKLTDKDFVVIVSKRFRDSIDELFHIGITNIFDGDAMLSSNSTADRFLRIASDYYIGPDHPKSFAPSSVEFLRYTSEPVDANNISKHKRFVVNSMPKSGTVWMMAMLEGLLGVRSKEQITLSHVFDIQTDWANANNHGAVVLVRDMRDVVVSWYHEVARTDVQNGFSSPRYPDIDAFYFEYLIGLIFGSARYNFGDLEKWLDFVSARSFPIIKYEELINDTQSALRKVMHFWKIKVSDEVLCQVAQDYSFDNMQKTVAGRDDYVSDRLKAGHMHQGKIGSWKKELSTRVEKDVNQRFSAYQTRLNYV